VIWLGAGRPASALEHVTRVFDRSDPAFHEAARFLSITYLADAAAHSGQQHVAAAILDELEAVAQRTPSPTLRGGSPRTVGSHLYRLFPKLGVTSRSQLTGALDGTAEGR
jgi:hypothetical protein